MKEITFVSGGTGQTNHIMAQEIVSVARCSKIGGEVNILYYLSEEGYLLNLSFLDSDIIRITDLR